MKIIIPVIILVLWNCKILSAQSFIAETHNKERLEAIETKLNELSDSLVTGLKQTANFSVVDAPIQELLRAIAETHQLNISVDPAINLRVTNNFTKVQVKNLLMFLCREYNLDIKFVNSIMSFGLYAAPIPKIEAPKPKTLKMSYDKTSDKLTLDLNADSLASFAKQLTQASGKNVILAPGLSNRLLSGFINDMAFDNAMDKISFANSLVVTKSDDGFYVVSSAGESSTGTQGGPSAIVNKTGSSNRSRASAQTVQQGDVLVSVIKQGNDTLLAIDAVNTPIAEIVRQASATARKNYVFFTEPQGNTTLKLKNVSYVELLSFLFQTSSYTFKEQQGIYLIGDRQQEGLRTTRVLQLQFRTVQDIEKAIPAEMSKGVDVKIFKELNSVILSGGAPQILEIVSFLKEVDKPVSNILIEVIVVEVLKGARISTGIKAGIADSTVSTGGSVFPGLDFTLSSKSVNDLLGRLSSGGLINLGKVSPNFYVALEALEQNNLLEVKSTPKLASLNGHEANLSIGQSRYYLEQTQNITGGVTPINSVSQRWNKVEANLAIKINPIVAGDDHITLNIEAEFSDFVEPTITGAPPGTASRKFISQVRIRNEEMIVLGGLEEARKQNSGSGVPLLSRIPVLKWFFSSRSSSNSDSKLIVFIKPTIVY